MSFTRYFAIPALLGAVATTASAATADLALPTGSASVAMLTQYAAPAPTEPEIETTRFDGVAYRMVDDAFVDQEGAWWRPLVVTTTAYSPTVEECDDDPDCTATGTNAYTRYGVAADPKALPYGTILRIPGYGDAPVDDTGSAMRKSWSRGVVHIDLRIPLRRFDGAWRSEEEANRIALAHGVRRNRIVLMKVASPAPPASPLP